MNRKHFKRAMADVTALADSTMDDELRAMAKPQRQESDAAEDMAEGEPPDDVEKEGEFTPEEVAQLKALLEQVG